MKLSEEPRIPLDLSQLPIRLTDLFRQVLRAINELYEKWANDARGVSVKDFGAKGDGVTDDTAAIQAAIKSIPESTGGPSGQGGYSVHFPAGVYKVSSTIFIGKRRISLVGSGHGYNGSNGTRIETSDPNVTIFDYTTGSLDTMSVFNLQLRGPGKNSGGTGCGIKFGRVVGNTAYDSLIERCWFVGFPGAAIVLQNAANYKVQHCTIELNGTGVLVRQSLVGVGDNNQISNCTIFSNNNGVLAEGANGLHISDNIFWLNGIGAGDAGTGDLVSGGVVLNTVGSQFIRGVTINSNTFRSDTNCIVIDGADGVNTANTGVNDVNVTGNHAQFVYRHFLLIKGANNILVTSNKLNGCSQEQHNTFPAISISGTSTKCYVAENHLTNNNSGRVQSYGLAAASLVRELGISNNHFEGASAPYNIVAGATLDTSMNLSGTWTPVIRGATTAGTQTYAQRTGTWQRIGNMVFVQGRVQLSGLDPSTTGGLLVDGLPFNTSVQSSVNLGSWGGVTFAGGVVTARCTPGFASFNLLVSTSAGANPTSLVPSAVNNTFNIDFSLHYAAS